MTPRRTSERTRARRWPLLCGAVAIAAVAAAQTQTRVRPGFNLFTVEQDIELGRASAKEVERQIPMVRDAAAERYVSDIGRRLAAVAPGAKYPYEFKVANLSDVNAFALPGGFLYVNRGLIEAVTTEGELAGVMAHEIAHVALRHQTNQVSKAYLARAGAGILGGLLGGGGGAGHVMQTLGGLGLNALFLKFSRTDEEQADVVGTQILARAGYNPADMARMFEMLRRQAGREPGRASRFFSDHPATADREARVRREMAMLGPVRQIPPVGNVAAVKAALARLPPAPSMEQAVKSLPAPPAPGSGPPAGGASSARVERPSGRWRVFEQRNGFFRIRYPDNWRVLEPPSGYGVTIVPPGGVVKGADGQQNVVYGVIVNHYDPFEGTIEGRAPARRGPAAGNTSLEEATNDLVAQIQRSNPYLRLMEGPVRRLSLGGARALSLVLSGRSPATGQEERVTLLTRALPDNHALYVLFIAPSRDYSALAPAFEEMITSLSVNDAGAHR